jgi:hypothetical protein
MSGVSPGERPRGDTLVRRQRRGGLYVGSDVTDEASSPASGAHARVVVAGWPLLTAAGSRFIVQGPQQAYK